MSGIGFFNCREHHVGQRDDCPICRIKELEKQVHDGYEAGWHALRNERDNLKAKLEAVKNCRRYIDLGGGSIQESHIGEYMLTSDVLTAIGEQE